MDISNRIHEVRRRILDAAKRAGRDEKEITLVAVSKTQPAEVLVGAYNEGIRIFGENKVQELIEKYPALQNVSWHLVGHLQKNKVKYIVDKVSLIHSLDSVELAEEINKRAKASGKVVNVLIQINIGKEETKSGIYEEDLEELTEKLSEYDEIRILGIMAIPPASKNPEDSRKYFRRMKELFEKLKDKKYDNFDIKYLSMGMTNDFEIAIEEGANIVRVGTGIFGERNYKGRN